ncbi:neprilysin-4 [Musca domestica]|uniref:Neprilysin-4 n=1 Tax=Musca domestica TaxID=7370 RepID=A0A1I8MQ60_MUSDO|nr:neprilysin-4 [Musca domestica]
MISKKGKTMLALLLLVTLKIVLSFGYHHHGPQDANVRLLKTLHSYMDTSSDPCQNFYQYACGNWENAHPNITSKYVDTFGSLDYIINKRIKFILQGRRRRKISRNFENNEIYRKVRSYLAVCEEQKKFEPEQYLTVFKPLPGVEWPENGEEWQYPLEQWNVWSTLGRLQAMGFNGFPLSLELKHENATHFRLELDKVNLLGFTAFEQKIVDHLEGSLNWNYRQLAMEMEEFLKTLAALRKNHNNFKEEKISLAELMQRVPSVDFEEFFENLLGLQREFFENIQMVVTNLAYFQELGELLRQTPGQTLIQMLRIKFLGYMEKQMPKVENHLHCLQHMRDLVPLALDYIYEEEVYRHQRNHSDGVIKRIFHRMQGKFLEILQQHQQEFSEPEIALLEEKISRMKLNIGNLPQVEDGNFYVHYFRHWYVTDNDFYWNHLNALQHHHQQRFKLLQLKTAQPQHTFVIWPYGSPAFQPSANMVVIPHAYLRFPIFHPDFHDLFLYAELGNTLGHEIMHAFDINGLDFDGQGNPTTLISSTLPNKKAFFKSLRCFSQQRSASLNEKIADISGFNLAYATYFDQHPPGEVFQFHPHSPLGAKQLFFIKFAQFFCAINPKRITYDESHDTPLYRVPQVVANHRDFEKVFHCPATKKNRIVLEKCNLW